MGIIASFISPSAYRLGLFLICFPIFFVSCTVTGKIIEDNYQSRTPLRMMVDTSPIDGHPVFFASSARLYKRENETEECLRSAALQAAMFSGINGEGYLFTEKTFNGTGRLNDFVYHYDTGKAVEFIPRLLILEKYQNEIGTFIKAALDSIKVGELPLEPETGRVPGWISEPPVVAGYYTGVGITLRQKSFTKSVQKADEKALEDIAFQTASIIRSGKELTTIEGVGASSSELTLEKVKATIKGFYVISRWRTDDEKYYYTLAVAKKD